MENNGFNLQAVFQPKTVAVVGASKTPRKWGYRILSNILAGGFQGPVYAVNDQHDTICGLRCYKTIGDIQDRVDLALITTPAHTVPQVVRDCVVKGVGGIVVISSGFSETDDNGRQLEQEIVSFCRRHRVPLVGPNTMGILSASADLYATGTHVRPPKGTIAFVSQSGNLGLQLIAWAMDQGIGISLFAGSGNEGLLHCVDYMRYLQQDPLARTIILYLEGVDHGAEFTQTARSITREKPIIALKGGRTDSGKEAAASHTGSLGGSTPVFYGACRQAGIVLAHHPSELLDLSVGFSALPLPKGNRVGIVTLGGGWGVVTSDACREAGLVLPRLSESIIAKVDRYLPSFWSRGNPMDLVGTQNPNAPFVAVEELVAWDQIDAVICLGMAGLTPLAKLEMDSSKRVDPEAVNMKLDQLLGAIENYEIRYAQRLVELMEQYKKPIVGVSMKATAQGPLRHVEGCSYSGVFYPTPEIAVYVLAKMAEYHRYRNARLES